MEIKQRSPNEVSRKDDSEIRSNTVGQTLTPSRMTSGSPLPSPVSIRVTGCQKAQVKAPTARPKATRQISTPTLLRKFWKQSNTKAKMAPPARPNAKVSRLRLS